MSQQSARGVLVGLAVGYLMIGYALNVGLVLMRFGGATLTFEIGYYVGAAGLLLALAAPAAPVVRMVSLLLAVAPPGVQGIAFLVAPDRPALSAAVRCAIIVGLEVAFWPGLLNAAAGRRGSG